MIRKLKCPICGETSPYEFSFDGIEEVESEKELAFRFMCCKCHGEWWAEFSIEIGEPRIPPTPQERM